MSSRSVSSPPTSERPAWLPSAPVAGAALAGAGSSGTQSATQPTKPELQALRAGPGRPSIPSWVEESESDRDTEITDLLDSSAAHSKSLPKSCPVLVRLDGVHAGQLHSLDGEPMSIGRHPANRLRIADIGISRFHARISRSRGQVWVEDLDSQNGTFVVRSSPVPTRRKIKEAPLMDGDIIHLGRRVGLRFALVDAPQEALMRQLYESSTRDALTGCYNRKHFDDRLKGELAYALRHGTSVALIMIDIDHFKSVNDRYGHSAGDTVLKQTARAISQRLRTEDTFARFGGEEFAVILRGVNLSGAARLGERLRATVAALPAVSHGHPIPVTISLGCATLACSEQKTVAALLEVADRRLYLAKNSGRNRVVFSD